jgi:acyl-CoA synthetase (AMP-forming)/AMP-acid ligase II
VSDGSTAGHEGAGRQGVPGLLAWCEQPPAGNGVYVLGERGQWSFESYRTLAGQVRAAARWLRADLGARPGDVIGLVLPPGSGFLTAFIAAMAAGCAPCVLPEPHAFGAEYAGSALAAMVQAARITTVLSAPRYAAVLGTGEMPARVVAVPALTDTAVPALTDTAGHQESAGFPDGTRYLEGTGWRGDELALVQFSSGSSGPPRPIGVSWRSLEAQLALVTRWTNASAAADAFATWLPPNHDMGLVGALLAPLYARLSIRIMSPRQFIGAPVQWLRCMGELGCTISAVPVFALRHVLARVRARDLSGLDFGGWKGLIVGAERLDESVFADFTDLLRPFGFRETALLPAYGLAEATLAVSGRPLGAPRGTVRVLPGRLAAGAPAVAPETASQAAGTILPSSGVPLPGVEVTVRGEDGSVLPDGLLGEIAVGGAPVAAAGDGPLLTGDAGFLRDGELYVLGRLGSSVKVHGRSVFAEDLEVSLAAIPGFPRRAAVVLDHHEAPRATLLVAGKEGDWAGRAARMLRDALGGRAEVRVFGLRPAALPYTTSGKPKRRELWSMVGRRAFDDLALWSLRAPASEGSPQDLAQGGAA